MILPSLLAALLGAATATTTAKTAPGIPDTLAHHRAATIKNLRYNLTFHIPATKTTPIQASEIIQLDQATAAPIILDFDQPANHLKSIKTAGHPSSIDLQNGHLTIPGQAGANTIEIEFIAGDNSLNRNDEFLYTLFVPARAHLAFPCFDQPDLKARYTLALEIPDGWQTVANGARLENAGPLLQFAETQPLSTYLFAFAAGKFQVETAERNGRTFHMLHRETDPAKVARNRDAIFDLHARAVTWLEDYTGIPYPWGKFDFLLIPSFQFGGMEHPGAILYNASSLMLDPSATQNQQLARASVIAHETAHMWFGDLVTMKWFNDVWMKEVMANFMAAKIVNPSFPEINHDLRFVLAHHPLAYGVDRTGGANPIRQPLANLNEAGSLYGAIIYNKAPIVMRQLEKITGETAFRNGMREYLRRYSFQNATWLDLIAILDNGNLKTWSRDWVETRSRPTLRTSLTPHLSLISESRTHNWPQHLEMVLGYSDHVERVPVSINNKPVTPIPSAATPAYILPNGTGLGYGLFLLDDKTLAYLTAHLEDIPDPLIRGAALVDLWENLIERRVKPTAFLDLAQRALPIEKDQQITQLLLSHLGRVWWRFLSQQDRLNRAPALEALLRQGINLAATPSAKSAWFSEFRNVALTPEGLAWLEQIWKREVHVPGLTLAEPDEIEIAVNLVVREVPHWREILKAQLDRTTNPDRKARFAFVMPALDADPAIRDRAFERLRDVRNRAHEPWVLESLQFLNHPLREEHARRYVRPSLELLPEIQRTGDIFFPKRWADATLGTQTSKQSAGEVKAYLARTKLPERLQWVILSAADELLRQAQ